MRALSKILAVFVAITLGFSAPSFARGGGHGHHTKSKKASHGSKSHSGKAKSTKVSIPKSTTRKTTSSTHVNIIVAPRITNVNNEKKSTTLPYSQPKPVDSSQPKMVDTYKPTRSNRDAGGTPTAAVSPKPSNCLDIPVTQIATAGNATQPVQSGQTPCPQLLPIGKVPAR
jgi:hypothetical protein